MSVEQENTKHSDSHAGHSHAPTASVHSQEHPARAKDVATEVKTDSHAKGETNPLLKLDPGLAIWTIISFVLLLLLVKKFAWGPILSSIEERERYLKSSMEEADNARKESRRVAEEQKSILDEAKSEADKVRREAHENSQAFKARCETEALEEKKRIIDSHVAELARMKDSALAELRSTVVDLTVEATRKLIDANLDENKARTLADSYIKEL
jgi:F-type H+-transporting ATPase subunit b